MIAVVDVSVQAANVSMPLFPWRAFRNSYSSVRVRNVPRKIGKWNITNVTVQVTYPDGSIKTADAVLTGGVWVATLEGTATAGTSLQGYKILASGIDENGQPVSNYCLGRGDVTILEDDGELIPENVTTYTRLLSSEPAQPKEGDLWQLSGTWYIYQDGTSYPIGDDSGLISQLSSDITQLSGQVQDKADKQIEAPRTISYQLPSLWYDLASGNTLSFNAVEGDTITWGAETQAKMTYNVKTHNLEYTASSSSEPLVLGVYAPDEIPTYVDYYDEQTGTDYIFEAGEFGEYEFTAYITEDVVYAEGGYAGISAQIAAKQDALTASQLAAVNSGITSEKVAAYDAALTAQVELAEDITYAELVALKNQSKLEAGKTYRITDYVTTTVQADTSANGSVLPIVVRAATSADIDPAGYMPNKKCEIKYCIDNDTNRFAWADTTNGKGVIYWMRDTHGNECPYDFKSIMFKPFDPRTNPNTAWFYTFDYLDTVYHVDASDRGYVQNNTILPAYLNVGSALQSSKQKLNNIVLRSNPTLNSGNYFSKNCYDISLGMVSPGGNVANWFGPACNRIYIAGAATYNFFQCGNNRLYLGYGHSYERFGTIANVIFGDSIDDLKSFFSNNVYEGQILGLKITSSQTTSQSNQIRGNIFGKYLAYTTGSTPLPTLDIDTVGQSYEIEYKRTGSKTITFN